MFINTAIDRKKRGENRVMKFIHSFDLDNGISAGDAWHGRGLIRAYFGQSTTHMNYIKAAEVVKNMAVVGKEKAAFQEKVLLVKSLLSLVLTLLGFTTNPGPVSS